MGKVVAISGGDLDSTKDLNEYIVSLSNKANPKLLFIPTASQDAEGYIEKIHEHFREIGCIVEALCLIAHTYSKKIIQSMIKDADIIYVGGGDTVRMMEIWKEYDVDKYLIEAYQEGKVLSGISAGAICWFSYGHSDSESFEGKDNWSYIWAKGIGLFPMAFCPHYNEEGRDSFDHMMLNMDIRGLALDNDTAFVEVDGEFKIIKANKEAKAYKISYKDGVKIKEEIKEERLIKVDGKS